MFFGDILVYVTAFFGLYTAIYFLLTIFETKNVAHSQYISGNDDKNTIGSLDYLHTYLINEVFKDKTYFDFGVSNENNGKNINEGLNYWKEGFGARTITQDFYEIDLNNLNKLDTIFT